MIKVYMYRGLAVLCALLCLAFIVPAIIGIIDIYLMTFSDNMTGLIDWTDGRGFRALLFGLVSLLFLIPIKGFLEAAEYEHHAIVKRVARRLST